MRKHIMSTISIALALVLILTACGGNTNVPTNADNPTGNISSKTIENLPPADLEETPIENFEYQYDPETQGIMIVSYKGSSIKVYIPEQIEDEPVTCIGDRAFMDSAVMSVYIPNSVKVIGTSAFFRCTGLIGSGAFAECTLLTNISIPNNITVIGDSAFRSCIRLTNITIPDSVTMIGEHAFQGCTGLTSITIPDSVTIIGRAAFIECTGLTDVTIGSGVTELNDVVFSKCTGLTNIAIPNSVTVIGSGTFVNCTALTSITIPDSVTEIGKVAFRGCIGLTNVTIPDSVTRIGYVNSVTPNYASQIGINEGAFDGCSNITVTYKGTAYSYENINKLYELFEPIE